MALLSKIIERPINSMEAIEFTRDPGCGALSLFEGNIRNQNKGQTVVGFYYEAYDALFHKIIAQILGEIQSRWDVRRMAVIQRIGNIDVGEVGIVIAVSSPHRRDSLDGLNYAIEEFKRRAPVWKKESTLNGDEWINWPLQHQSENSNV